MSDDSGIASNHIDMIDKSPPIDPHIHRYPFCIVWTPIPFLTWLCPLIGHMGIAMSSGVIRDFAGPYYVSEDNMAFGWPTKYLQLDPSNARNGVRGWDTAVTDASEVYKGRMHNLCCDNCHSHVAMSLNKMNYKNSSWNMVKLAFWIAFKGKYVSVWAWLKSWLPFFILVTVAVIMYLIGHYIS
ncbi:hypothetical protein R5R35_012829 [Gryllus longicercus]|uniref:Transmembrane protein 222 n=1 Tax=Gryllus longicercus TaxID=2509291 RepID=A0AAN9VDR1_9ORTH|nr:Uncharacterized protein GBIM_13921 [Gryllus bimaculatus]